MSSNRSPQRPVAAEATHLRILRAATAAFAERGYAATSVGCLIECARVDLPTFEAHFNDTEDCFLQAYDRIVAEAAARIVASLPVAAPWPQRLAAGLSTLFELVADDRAAARLVLVEALGAFPAAALTRYVRLVDRVALFMREARALAGTDPPPPISDVVLPNGIAFMLTDRLRQRPRDPVAELLPEALRLLLLPYLGEPETAEAMTAASASTTVV